MKDQLKFLWNGKDPRRKSIHKRVHEILEHLEKDLDNENCLYLERTGYIDFLFDQINRDSPNEYIRSIAIIVNNCPKYTQHEFYIRKTLMDEERFRLLIHCLLRVIVSDEDCSELLVFLHNMVLFLPRSTKLWDTVSEIFDVSLLDPISEHLEMGQNQETYELLKQSNKFYNKLSSEEKELAFIAKTWFSKLINRFMKSEIFLPISFVRFLIAILSYIPTRKYTVIFLRQTCFLPRVQKNIAESSLKELQYLVYYPMDENQNRCLTHDESNKFISDRVIHFISTAFNAYHFVDFVKCADILTLTRNLSKFSECFGKKPEKASLIHLCKDMQISFSGIDALSTEKIITCLWYSIADFRIRSTNFIPDIHLDKTIHKQKLSFSSSSFLETNDMINRTVSASQTCLQELAEKHINNVLDRLDIRYQDHFNIINFLSRSKYAMRLDHAPVILHTSSHLYEDLYSSSDIQIVMNCKGVAKTVQQEWTKIERNEMLFLVFFVEGEPNVLPILAFEVTKPADSRIIRILAEIDTTKFDENFLEKAQLIIKPNVKVSSLARRYFKMLKLSRSTNQQAWIGALFDKKYQENDGVSFVLTSNIQLDKDQLHDLQHVKKARQEEKSIKRMNSQSGKDIMVNFSDHDSKDDITFNYVNYLGRDNNGKFVSLNSKQSSAFIKAISAGFNVMDGKINTGKTEIIQHLLTIYATEFNERSLVIVGSKERQNSLMQRLDHDMLISILKGDDISKVIYQKLLKKASIVAKELEVTDFTCESISSCLELYYDYILPFWNHFKNELKAAPLNYLDIISRFPFIDDLEDFKNCSFEESIVQVTKLFNRRLDIFRKLESLRFVECLHHTSGLFEFSLIAASDVVIATTYDLTLNEYDLGKFDNIIVMNAESIPLSDLLLVPLTCMPKRLIITGNLFWSNSNSLLYQIGDTGKYTNLTEQYYHGKSVTGRENSFVLSSVPPNGFYHNLQFVDVKGGIEECHSGQYANRKEAEFVALVYIYMKKIGLNTDQICVLTTYELQKALIQEMIQNLSRENGIVLNTDLPVFTVDEMRSSKYNYLIVSLVDTENHRSNPQTSSSLMCNLFNSAANGLYIFGSEKTASDLILRLIPVKSNTLELLPTKGSRQARKISSGMELKRMIRSINS